MKVATSHSTKPKEIEAITDCYINLEKQLQKKPDWLLLSFTVGYNNETLLQTLRELAPGVPIHGGTSCLGVMTQDGFHRDDDKALGLFGLCDPEGNYGVGSADLGEDLQSSVAQALLDALEQCERPGELPTLAWITPAPGMEEALLQSIEGFFGTNIPIIGGSSADNDLSGQWKQLTHQKVHSNAIVISLLFPSTKISYTFRSGYEPTKHKGRITKTKERIIYEIDNRPAIDVYKEWIGQNEASQLPKTGNVLSKTTFHPIGREVGQVGSIPYFQLSHPEKMQEDGSMTTFTSFTEGEEIYLMTGDPESLVQRAAKVAQVAVKMQENTDHIAGALVIYCAGCMLATQERMSDVSQKIAQQLNDRPFLGTFTYGEQGCFIGGENRHGNLMISMLIFGT